MEFANELLYFVKNFIGTPAILVGLFGMLGSILQKKSASQVLTATIKTITGFLILGGGATLLTSALDKFDVIFQAVFGVAGSMPNNDGLGGWFVGQMPELASLASIVMIIGMVANIILAKATRFKYIYLSGHVMFYMSVMLAVSMAQIGMTTSWSGDAWMIILTGGVFMGLYMILSPAMCRKFVQEITKNNDISMAHTGSLGYVMAGYIGMGIKKISKREKLKSTEEINFPKGLAFLRNQNVSVSLTMIIIFTILFSTGWGVLGKDWFVENQIIGTTDSLIVVMLVRAFTFAAGMEVILFGVRIILGELIPAFKGVSDKLVKNAKASLDCPIVFPYAQNAVFIGFISSFVGGMIGMGITIGITQGVPSAMIIIPGIVAHFFTGATSGVFGNSKGGILGAIIGAFVNGLFITFVPLFFILLGLIPQEALAMSWGDSDYIYGLLIGIFKKFEINQTFMKYLIFGLFVGAFSLLIIVEQILYWTKVKSGKIVRTTKAIEQKQTQKEEQSTVKVNN